MNSFHYIMNRTGKILFYFVLSFCFFKFIFVSSLNASIYEESKDRKSKIDSIIQKFTKLHEDIRDNDVQEAIYQEVSQHCILEPKTPPNEKGVSEIAAEIRVLVKKRFPKSMRDIKAAAEKQAKLKYKLLPKLQKVTVRYRQGEQVFEKSGRFYGYGIGENSVRIGDGTPIAFFDLLDEDRAKFDMQFCEKLRKKYIQKIIRTYNNRKQSFLNSEFNGRREDIAKENERLGYIYAWKKWLSPKQVTEILIKNKISEQEKSGTYVKNTTETKDPFDLNEKDPVPVPDPDPVDPINDNPPEDENHLKLVRLKQKVEKSQLEIAGNNYGVDADQGFRKGDLMVLLNLAEDEVNMLTGKNSNVVSYAKGKIDTVTFHYVNKVLYKIEIKYRIGPRKLMIPIYQEFKDKYGESIEGKEANKKKKEQLARIKAIKNLCPNGSHKWKKGKCEKCGVKKDDIVPPPVKLNMVENWKGKTMEIQLITELLPDASNFSKFILIKQNPKIKEEQEKLMEEERIRKEEEQRRKEEEEFKNNF